MLLQTIDEDLKKAQKEKNDITVSALRNLKAALKNAEIAAQTLSGRASPTDSGREKQRSLSDEEALVVIAKKVKQHKDSIAEFGKGGRMDLVSIEKSQMAVLEKFLPEALSEEQLEQIVKEVIGNLSATATDFGKVMKEVVARVKGAADGAVISKIVKEHLK